MITARLFYKKAIQKKINGNKRAMQRLTSTVRREIKRSTKRFARHSAKHLKKTTGIKLTQKHIQQKVIRDKFYNSSNINYMKGVLAYPPHGVALIHFVVGKPKATTGPVSQRKSPRIRIYKGKSVRVARTFIIKYKTRSNNPELPVEKENYLLLRRSDSGTHLPFSPSIPSMLKAQGFDLNARSIKERKKLVINISHRRDWIFAPMR